MLHGMPSAPPTRRTQAERRAETQRRIYTAAVEVLVEGGYAAMTLNAVVKRAGVSPGALWRYCKTKAELAYAAVQFVGGEEQAAGAAELPDTDVDTVTRWLLHEPSDLVGRGKLELLRAAAGDEELREILAESTWTGWLGFDATFREALGIDELDARTASMIRVLALAHVGLQVFFRDEDVAGVLRDDIETLTRETLVSLEIQA